MPFIKLKPLIASLLKEGGAEDPERVRSVPLKEEAVKQLLRTSFSKAAHVYVKNHRFGLYRGYIALPYLSRHKLGDEYYHVDPTTKYRASSGTNNFYTSFISTSPRWRDYPRRDHSVIGSTSDSAALKYGDSVFYVVPENGAKFAFCDEPDCWNSFKYASELIATPPRGGLPNINTTIAMFFTAAANVLSAGDDTMTSFAKSLPRNYDSIDRMIGHETDKFIKIADDMRDDIIENLMAIVKQYNELRLGSYSMSLQQSKFASLIEQYPSFRELFEDMFDPEKNNIKLVSSIDDPVVIHTNHSKEFWTDAKCLLIPLNKRHIFQDALTGATI